MSEKTGINPITERERAAADAARGPDGKRTRRDTSRVTSPGPSDRARYTDVPLWQAVPATDS
jgi:hypothetical protein